MNVIDFFDKGAQRWPERACFIAGERTFSYAEVSRLTHRIASKLSEAGHTRDSKCAVLSPNDPVAFTCALGILRAGCVWTPINPRNGIEENIYLLDFFECEALFYHSDMAEAAEQLLQRLPRLRSVVCIDQAHGAAASLEQWLGQDDHPYPLQRAIPEAAALMVPTGGTTGLPKGVMLSNRNIATFCANVLSCLNFDEPPVCLACAPLTHAAGIFAFPLMSIGATHVIHRAVDPAAALAAIQEHQVNFLFLPPTVIYALLAHPDLKRRNLSSLRYLLYGASPMAPAKLREALEAFGPVMAQMFGQSEAPASVTYLAPADHFDSEGRVDEERLKSCGRATPFARVEIMSEAGEILGPGVVGEIVVQGDLVMMGYYRNEEATAEAFAHGWHHTGDLGYRDEQGFFFIVDRKKDMIISGGMNIYATEVEQVVMRHEAVQECAAIGVPDDKWGEAVKAVVELKPGHAVSPDDLIAFCKSHIGSVKAPKSIDIVERLPRSPIGKVLKRELRDAAWVGRERRVS